MAVFLETISCLFTTRRNSPAFYNSSWFENFWWRWWW